MAGLWGLGIKGCCLTFVSEGAAFRLGWNTCHVSHTKSTLERSSSDPSSYASSQVALAGWALGLGYQNVLSDDSWHEER